MREEKDYSNFMTTVELAARWKKSPRTLENWRVQGIGPNFYKIGAAVLYKVNEIEELESAVKEISTGKFDDTKAKNIVSSICIMLDKLDLKKYIRDVTDK